MPYAVSRHAALDGNDLTPEEREEFDRLFSAAQAEANRQMVVLVDPAMVGTPLRSYLKMLRDGTWRKRIATWH